MRVYDARTGQEALALKGPAPLLTPVFSPDGTRIAVAPSLVNGDGAIRVWTAPRDAAAWRAERRQALADGVAAWHQTQEEEYARTGQGFAAGWHLGWLLDRMAAPKEKK